jgi:V/A-type H+/Na+-transporting ATPase subunit E
MAEELQHLIERIQAEAFGEAESRAADLRARAEETAAAIVREAEQRAQVIVARAEEEAKRSTERSLRALEQASRDLLIFVGRGVETILDGVVSESLDEAMSTETIREMLVRMAETYLSQGGEGRRVALLVSPEDQEALSRYYAERFREQLHDTVEIRLDGSISRGFRASFADEHATHDFTKEAIAETLSSLLRPRLAEIVLRVAGEAHGHGAEHEGAA